MTKSPRLRDTLRREDTTMADKKNVAALRVRYERLKASIGDLGLVQIGSVSERIDRRTDAQGRLRDRGPYYQWTFKEAGKTRTVNLTGGQAAVWTEAIRNHRKLEKILGELRKVSLRILNETTEGVARRQPANKKQD
jgi:hypothetical protein